MNLPPADPGATLLGGARSAARGAAMLGLTAGMTNVADVRFGLSRPAHRLSPGRACSGSSSPYPK